MPALATQHVKKREVFSLTWFAIRIADSLAPFKLASHLAYGLFLRFTLLSRPFSSFGTLFRRGLASSGHIRCRNEGHQKAFLIAQKLAASIASKSTPPVKAALRAEGERRKS